MKKPSLSPLSLKTAWLVSLLSLFAFSTNKCTAVLVTAGIDDQFAAPSDPPSPSSALITVIGNAGFNATEEFDVFVNNNTVGHTFQFSVPANHAVTAATLEGRVRANPGANAPGTTGDGVLLSLIESTSVTYQEAIVWSRNFGMIEDNGDLFPDNDPGLIQASPWLAGDQGVFTLDLAALPNADGTFTNLIPLINERLLLDVVAGDDSAVDFYRLTYSTAAVPEPTTSAWATLAFGLIASRLRRQRG